MRSITIMLMLTSFLVLQYARQVSYWECRLSNYFKTASQKCDCEKLVKQVEGQGETSPVPVVHNHFHLDESFYPSRIISAEEIYCAAISAWCLARQFFTGKIIPARVDHPPQIG
jgi:hypothetical protein